MIWRFKAPLNRTCRVVFAGPHFQAGLSNTRELLAKRNIPNVELMHAPTDEELMSIAPTVHVAIPFMQRFDVEFIQKAENLRLIQQYGVGLEGIDMDEATRRGIAVANIPADGTGNAQSTAEHALLLSFSLLRFTKNELTRRVQERILGGLPPPRTLYRQNVTVVGYGSVGSALCKYLTVMGGHVTAVRRSWENRGGDPNVYVRSTVLEETLPTTDLLILACPVTPDTFHLMNKERIALLPKNALIVNVGRGPLVEYIAIREAIESGHIGGFASDVGVGHPTKPSEPWDPDDELTKHPNVLFTPHVGGYSEYTSAVMAENVVSVIENIIARKPPNNWANKFR
jgi:phosphoglycerate dehydrogenase-like enzyme